MPRKISKRNLESVKQQVREYDVTLTRIIPRDIERGSDAVGEEIFFLLYNRETLEKDFQKYGIEGELASLWQQVQELDALLLARREAIVDAFHRDYYRKERERLKMPQAYWWWYLDELGCAELPRDYPPPKSQHLFDLSPEENKELQNFFDLNPEAFDRLIDVGGRKAIEDLRSIKESLEDLFEQEEIERWLHAPNQMFDGKTPVEAMVKGQTYRILQLLIRLEEGIHY